MLVLTEVLARAYEKDHQAFEMLYEHYKLPLGNRLMSTIHDREAIDDLYQETFIRVWRHFLQPKNNVASYFERWLYYIAGNLAIDYVRHKKLIAFQPLLNERFDESYGLTDLLWTSKDEVCDLLCLKEAIAAITPQCRICLFLHVYWGFSQQEIAWKLGVTESTISASVSRGRKQLNEHYSEWRRTVRDTKLSKPPLDPGRYGRKAQEHFGEYSLEEWKRYQEEQKRYQEEQQRERERIACEIEYRRWENEFVKKESVRARLLQFDLPKGLPPRVLQFWRELNGNTEQEPN